MDRGAWQAIIHRVAKSWTWLKWLSMHVYLLFNIQLAYSLTYRISWISNVKSLLCGYFPKRRKWGRSLKAEGIESLGRKPYTSFSSPEFGPLSPHIFTRMAEQQPSWEVLCHPPRLFPRTQNGPSGKYSRLPGSRTNIEQLFLPKADIHFSFNCTFYM